MATHNYSTSTGIQTGSLQVYSSQGALAGIDVTPPGTGVTTITVYDTNTNSASGTVLLTVSIPSGVTSLSKELSVLSACTKGLYASFSSTGTGSTYIIRYIPS